MTQIDMDTPPRRRPHRRPAQSDVVGRPSRHTLYRRLDSCLEELKRIGGLPSPLEAKGLWDHLWAAEAHHSTAIEGNTLVLKQVEALLLEGRPIGGKELAEYLDVKGYANAAEWVYSQALQPGGWGGGDLVTVTEVREIHRTALSLVWEVAPHPLAGPDESPGSFRRHAIQPFGSGMSPPPWTDVPAAVGDLVARVKAIPSGGNPRIELIADAHAAFERIHPFIDGNGRAGRLLLNLVLVRLGYPPAIIYKRDRRRYLSALRAADDGDPGALGEILARAVLDNYLRLVLPAIAGPHRLVPLSALVSEDVTLRALRNAASRGRLVAARGDDGLWRSTRKAVDGYLLSRYERVPGASATCGECGVEISDPSSLPYAERMPCPNCGSKRVNFMRSLSANI
jgi:Fic family protein/DNA-directed RNA polymerase subunit RPC12/RpoP